MCPHVFITTPKRYLELIAFHYTLVYTLGLYEAMLRFRHVCDTFLKCDIELSKARKQPMIGMEDVSDKLAFDLQQDSFESTGKHENKTYVTFW